MVWLLVCLSKLFHLCSELRHHSYKLLVSTFLVLQLSVPPWAFPWDLRDKIFLSVGLRPPSELQGIAPGEPQGAGDEQEPRFTWRHVIQDSSDQICLGKVSGWSRCAGELRSQSKQARRLWVELCAIYRVSHCAPFAWPGSLSQGQATHHCGVWGHCMQHTWKHCGSWALKPEFIFSLFPSPPLHMGLQFFSQVSNVLSHNKTLKDLNFRPSSHPEILPLGAVTTQGCRIWSSTFSPGLSVVQTLTFAKLRGLSHCPLSSSGSHTP